MRRICEVGLAAVVALFLCVTARAQNTALGVKGGPSFSRVGDFNFLPGFNVGGFYTQGLSHYFGFTAEVNYARQQAQVWRQSELFRVKSDYVQVAVLPSYFVRDGLPATILPKFFAGPQVGVLTQARSFSASAENMETAAFRGFEMGLTAGAGLYLNFGKKRWFYCDTRYYTGLHDIDKQSGGVQRTTSVSVNAGFSFPVKY